MLSSHASEIENLSRSGYSRPMATLSLRCQCGAFRGVAHSLVASGANRFICHCGDCQAYAHYLGKAEVILDANGGTDLTPMTPSQIEITVGHETLSALRLTPKGMFRWYADCCNTPIGNTMGWPRVPFVGVVHSILDPKASGTKREEAVGPVRAAVRGKHALDIGFLVRVLWFVLQAFWAKKHQPSPFFHPGGKPRAKPKILAPAERENLRKICSP
jgi:hypothetical protein